jgi:hypothetical protein
MPALVGLSSHGVKMCIAANEEALMAAIRDGNIPEIRSALAQGADVNYRNVHGTSPLDEAVHAGSVEIAELLIDCGAVIDAVSRYGATPCLEMTTAANLYMLRMLLDHGADVPKGEPRRYCWRPERPSPDDTVAVVETLSTESVVGESSFLADGYGRRHGTCACRSLSPRTHNVVEDAGFRPTGGYCSARVIGNAPGRIRPEACSSPSSLTREDH